MVSYKAAAMKGVDAAAFKQAQLRQAAEKFARALQIQPGVRVYQAKHAALLLDAGDAIYPMFATHNAQTIASVHRMARAMRNRRDFEDRKSVV